MVRHTENFWGSGSYSKTVRPNGFLFTDVIKIITCWQQLELTNTNRFSEWPLCLWSIYMDNHNHYPLIALPILLHTSLYNIISIYKVTVTITPDAAASRGNRHPGDKDYFHRNGNTYQPSSTYTPSTLENESFCYRNCPLSFGWCWGCFASFNAFVRKGVSSPQKQKTSSLNSKWPKFLKSLSTCLPVILACKPIWSSNLKQTLLIEELHKR